MCDLIKNKKFELLNNIIVANAMSLVFWKEKNKNALKSHKLVSEATCSASLWIKHKQDIMPLSIWRLHECACPLRVCSFNRVYFFFTKKVEWGLKNIYNQVIIGPDRGRLRTQKSLNPIVCLKKKLQCCTAVPVFLYRREKRFLYAFNVFAIIGAIPVWNKQRHKHNRTVSELATDTD